MILVDKTIILDKNSELPNMRPMNKRVIPIISSDPSRHGLSRRKFILLSAVAAGGVAAGGCAFARPRSAPRLVSANDKMNIAIVGYGGQGAGDADACDSENIIALCDADEKIGAKVRAKFPKAAYYQDFRKMLDNEKSLDALNIATPDHAHAYIAAAAMNMGKHVYVQKPLTHSVYEARLLRKLAKESKVATQMGNQGSAENGLRRGVEVIQAGIIGQVHDVHVWSNRPIWPQGIEGPSDWDPVPEGLDWDLWLGPAPWRPFKGSYMGTHAYHPFNWRGWIDFGTGALGDMACHTVNLPFRALKLGYPTEIEAETAELTKESYPIKSTIRFQFPAREGLAPVTFRWYDGGNRIPNATRSPFHDGHNKPPVEVTADIVSFRGQVPQSGCLMIGEKGQVFSPDDSGTRFFLKLKDDKEFTSGPTHPSVAAIPQSIPRNPFMAAQNTNSLVAHHQEWIAACKGGPRGYSDFDIAAYLTEIILLGCVAMRAGERTRVGRAEDEGPESPRGVSICPPELSQGMGALSQQKQEKKRIMRTGVLLDVRYIVFISFVAAMGGLLFGYDWVVIGGAKPFFEKFFHIANARTSGWVNSCALIGCLFGAVGAGALSDKFGRKRLLVLSAFLFTVTSLGNAAASSLPMFVAWRIMGGVAIGLASNLSPMYIAEISPPLMRGRLVSINQLTIVIGILAAQVINWSLVRGLPAHAADEFIATTWHRPERLALDVRANRCAGKFVLSGDVPGAGKPTLACQKRPIGEGW